MMTGEFAKYESMKAQSGTMRPGSVVPSEALRRTRGAVFIGRKTKCRSTRWTPSQSRLPCRLVATRARARSPW